MATNQPGALDSATDLFMVENRAETTLNTALNNGASTVDVVDGSVFPSSGRFKITVENEVIDIASRAGNTLTVESRGAEGTSDVTHGSGSTVSMQFTKGHYETLRDAIINTQEGYMRRPTTDSPQLGVSKFGGDPFENIRRFAL